MFTAFLCTLSWGRANLFVPPAYVSANDENGERILHTAPTSPLPRAPALPPKQGSCQPHNHCWDICPRTWLTILCCHADRWPSSPLSRSPAPDRRILTSSVPASPTNPMRRLILSPSPLTQSECTVKITPALNKVCMKHLAIYPTRLQVSFLKQFRLSVFLLYLPTALNEELKMKLEKRRVSQDWPFHEGMTHSHSVLEPQSPLLRTHPVPLTGVYRKDHWKTCRNWPEFHWITLGRWTIWTGS